eukprot:599146-Rhodomonas_salina.3
MGKMFAVIAIDIATVRAMTTAKFWQNKVSEAIDVVKKHCLITCLLTVALILTTIFLRPVVRQQDWSNVSFMANQGDMTTIERERCYLDTCCSISIINNPCYMSNIVDIPETLVTGVNWYRAITKACMMQLPIINSTSRIHTLVIDNVFFDPGCHINLVSMKQVKKAGYKAVF